MRKRIYLDNAATTPIHPKVWDAMTHIQKQGFGNPSSTHAEGRFARTLIEEARRIVAKSLGASLGEIFFTSCGTESNNMVLLGAIRDLGIKRVLTSPVEHHCVLHCLANLSSQFPIEVVQLTLDAAGLVEMDHLASLLLQKDAPATLVSLMHVNNETGAMHDLERIGQLCQLHGALFHSDTVQSIGFQALHLETLPVDFITGSAHKFYGPKGSGFVFLRSGHSIKPFLFGGSQERNMRAGTENILGIHGLGQAMNLAEETSDVRLDALNRLRSILKEGIQNTVGQVTFNGESTFGCSPKILSVNFPPQTRTELLLMHLDIAGISASGGSACSSGVAQASHVLSHLPIPEGFQTVRFSFSPENTVEEIEYVVATLHHLLNH
jgi:cysteine desulfurase